MNKIVIIFLLSIMACLFISCSRNKIKDSTYNIKDEQFKIHTIGCTENDSSRLKKLYYNSYSKGITCLLNQGQDRQDDADNLSKLVQAKDVHIVCEKDASDGDSAHAITNTASPYFPGLELNMKYLNLKNSKNLGMFFHESIHWLGYKHFEGIDVSYLAESCCFNKNANKNSACILFNLNKEEWLTTNYIESFTKIMSDRGYAFIALRTAWNAAVEKKGPLLEGGLIFALKGLNNSYDEEYLENNVMINSCTGLLPINTLIYSTALAKSSDSIVKKAAESYEKLIIQKCFSEKRIQNPKKIFFLKSIGKILAGILYKDIDLINKTWNSVSIKQTEICSNFSLDEKMAIGDILQSTHISLFDLHHENSKLTETILNNWMKICK